MKRLAALLVLFASFPVGADETPGRKQTVDFVRALQTESGGFRNAAKAPPSLRATSAAARALHHLNSDVPDRDAAAKFVASCFDPQSGGFADTPGGKTDVALTAIGLMAAVELKMPTERYAEPAGRYLTDNAKDFEDIRIAVAGFEAIEKKPAKAAEWIAAVTKSRNADGTFGSGLTQARDTGGAVVALMRLGEKTEKTDAILAALRAGQRPGGGFGKAGSEKNEDLESTYRVMRCFAMLKAQPTRVEGLRSFVAVCRNGDGGYGVAPAQPSTVAGTYYATIIEKWLAK